MREPTDASYIVCTPIRLVWTQRFIGIPAEEGFPNQSPNPIQQECQNAMIKLPFKILFAR